MWSSYFQSSEFKQPDWTNIQDVLMIAGARVFQNYRAQSENACQLRLSFVYCNVIVRICATQLWTDIARFTKSVQSK